VGTFLKVI